MLKLIDLTGKRFGRLTVIKRVENDKWGHHQWFCECVCKNRIIVPGNSLSKGSTKSCGCLQKEKLIKRSIKHGYSRRGERNKIYGIWADIIQRCTNSRNKGYKNYGGRGITVCKRWLKFENFNEDMGKGWKLGLTIERKNNNKGYYKNNCKWATRKEQMRNTRDNLYITYNGKTQLLLKWSEETEIPYATLYKRIYILGWLTGEALTTSIGKRRKG